MRYIDHGSGGPPSCMIVRRGPVPKPQKGEVLIDVAYAGVNRPDLLQRQGAYPPPSGASPVLGLEVSGTIAAAHPDVTGLYVGDPVTALVPGGGYAEYCIVPAAHCLPVPADLTLSEAAALPENYFTVWSNVFERGSLQAGENFLVHGGAGGIGYSAIQLARAFGAKVFTTVAGKAQIDAVMQLGADVVLDYNSEDWEGKISGMIGRRGLDCILDFIGGSYIQKNLKLLARNGRLVQIAFLQGARGELDLMPVLTKNLTITGSMLRPRSIQEKAAIASALREKVWPLFAQKKLRVLISAVFDLADVQKAHEMMEASAHIGKIVLKVRG